MRALLALAACLACARASADLPEYRPQAQVSGVIRTWGSDHMAVLMKNWEEGFRKVQPGVAFVDNLKGTASATTVRAGNGKRTVHDGPFAETKEQLGGY